MNRAGKIIHGIVGVLSSAPISLRPDGPGGTPYVVSSLYEVFMHPIDRLRMRKDSVGSGWAAGPAHHAGCLAADRRSVRP